MMDYKVNLLPPRLQRENIIDVRRLVVIVLTTLISTVVFGGYAVSTINYFIMKNELAETKRQLSSMAPLVKRVEDMRRERAELEATVKEYDSIMKKQVIWSSLLDDLGDVTPVDLWLTSLEVSHKAGESTPGSASASPEGKTGGQQLSQPAGATPEPQPQGQAKTAARPGSQQPGAAALMPKPNAVTFTGYSLSIPSIGIFANNLYSLPYFKEIKINKITSEKGCYKFEISSLVRDDLSWH